MALSFYAKNILNSECKHFYYSNPFRYYMNPQNRSDGTLKVHLVCWAIFIAYEILVAGMISGQYAHPVYYVAFYALNIVLFYVHAHFLMPSAFDQGKKTIWRLPFLLAVELSLYLAITIALSYALELLNLRNTPLQLNSRFFLTTVWRSALFMMFSSGYYFLRTYLRRAKDEMARAVAMAELNSKLIRAERDFLKAQINPHLLFNTLNFVRYASKRKPEQVDEAIVRLSELMHFAMEKTADGLIPVQQELAQIDNIIQLNQMRFDGKLNLICNVELEDQALLLIPTVLLTLVENVFKHGDLLDPAAPAEITFHGNSGEMLFCTRNRSENSMDTYPSTKLGIANIKTRLNDYYGSNAILEHGNNDGWFWTKLTVKFRP